MVCFGQLQDSNICSLLTQPEVFRFTESKEYYLSMVPASHILISLVVKDNDDLAIRGSTLLVRMCGVTPPVPLVNPILDAIFDAIQTSPV